MAYLIKTEIDDPRAKTFVFKAQKTMYGAKRNRQGTNKIGGISDEAAAFLRGFF